MFTRKLAVVLIPLLLAAGVCWLFPLAGSLGFFSNVVRGLLLGGALALLLPLSGAGKRKEPFGHLLWAPALALAAAVGYQYGASAWGWDAPLLAGLATQNGQVVLVECAFCAFMAVTCLRTRQAAA